MSKARRLCEWVRKRWNTEIVNSHPALWNLLTFLWKLMERMFWSHSSSPFSFTDLCYLSAAQGILLKKIILKFAWPLILLPASLHFPFPHNKISVTPLKEYSGAVWTFWFRACQSSLYVTHTRLWAGSCSEQQRTVAASKKRLFLFSLVGWTRENWRPQPPRCTILYPLRCSDWMLASRAACLILFMGNNFIP